MLGLRAGPLAGRRHRRHVVVPGARPDQAIRDARRRVRTPEHQNPRIARSRRARGRVGQEHDRCLEPFGAVHGHDANFVADDVHVALHLRSRRPHERDKTLQ